MNKYGIGILLFILFVAVPVFGALYNDIPQTTLNIAKSVSINQYNDTPSTKIVRVGIGTNNFSSYEWNNAEIYSTGEFELYNNNTYITTIESNDFVKINMVGKIFVLTDSSDNVLAKVSGPIKFKSDYGYFGINNLKRAGKDAMYRGQIQLVSSNNVGKFYIVNYLELEDYLKGVVPNEMPVSFGLEALKAQSVAARNYVLSPRTKANPNYDVVDSVASQVYFGVNTEKDLSNQAIKETTGIVALYGWDLIIAQYSSTAGGYTESYHNAFSDPITKAFPPTPKPYLLAKPDYDDFPNLQDEEEAKKFYKTKPKSFDVNSSYYRWERKWTASELENAIKSTIVAQSSTGFVKPMVVNANDIGKIKQIKVTKRGNSGKIMELEILTDTGTYTVQKELIIRRLFVNQGKALPSANLVFEQEFDDNGFLSNITAYGGGFGHGVGMSQYGAGYMGKELKMSFDKILKHYYSNIVLATVPKVLSSNAKEKNVEQTFYAKYGKAILVIDNKYKSHYINAVINGVEERFDLNTDERYNQIVLSKYLRCGMNTIKFSYPEKQGGIKFYIELAGEDGTN